MVGLEAIIMAGVTIGDGAIIGTSAVVTKDIQLYTIVRGVPAKIIRKRFSDADIEKLLSIKWWDWTVERIAMNRKYIQVGNLKVFEI